MFRAECQETGEVQVRAAAKRSPADLEKKLGKDWPSKARLGQRALA
jgi:hypothetical protein